MQQTPIVKPSGRQRRLVAAALTLTVAAALGCARSAEETPTVAEQPRPIIIVDIDTLRASHLGCYGYERPTSPHLDAFAQETHFFEWAFSQAPNTPPSQTSILTGLYPSTHGMVLDEDRVPEEVVTLAEALKAQGYVTAAFVDGGYMSPSWGIGQGFDLYDDNRGQGLKGIGPKASAWLQEHHAETFLLLLHTYDAHTPYSPPEPYQSMFLDGLAPPTPGFEPNPQQMEAIRTSVWTAEPKSLPENDLEYAKARYDGGIRYIDDWFGRFLVELRGLGLLDRAIVVVISDHGEEFQEHGSVLHEKLYSTVTHIPLMIRLPGAAGARRIPQVVEAIDLMPTLLELTGAPVPEGVQGQSLVPLMEGVSTGPQAAISESPYFGVQRSIATGGYRLQYTQKGEEVELYRFRDDPDEQHDLAGDEPQVVEQLQRNLRNWQRMIDQGSTYDADGGEMPAETREQLKALGYVQ